MKQLTIGNVTLKNNIILAPMAGVSDLPFRLLCHEQGAGLVCMEMISAKAILYRNKNTEMLMAIHPDEGDVSLQLFGSDPRIMSEIAKKIEDRPFRILDINMGCPVPKIVGNGEGSALMRDPLLAGKIIEAVSKAVKKPVTVKIRKGFDDAHVNAAQIAHIAQESGAAAVIVHGRTREQYYTGKADWDIIRQVKECVSIPVIGNGDITGALSAKAMMEQTGCDGVMVGRAAQGNPWIFHEIATYLETGEMPERPDRQVMLDTIVRHAKLQLAHKGEYVGIREMRKHVSWYSAGMPHSAKFRSMINSMGNMEDLIDAVKRIYSGG